MRIRAWCLLALMAIPMTTLQAQASRKEEAGKPPATPGEQIVTGQTAPLLFLSPDAASGNVDSPLVKAAKSARKSRTQMKSKHTINQKDLIPFIHTRSSDMYTGAKVTPPAPEPEPEQPPAARPVDHQREAKIKELKAEQEQFMEGALDPSAMGMDEDDVAGKLYDIQEQLKKLESPQK
ncbi:MAG TPA: hypothetical protein VHL58_17315 [Thermoanaerobaculia bacterium]|nr:hypothetical protein [Thermoanaerobaculia bacterium]